MSQQICISSDPEILKYVEKLLLFACLVFLEPYVKRYTISKFLTKFEVIDELSFFPRAGVLCLVKCDEGRFSSSVFTSWRRPFK